MQCQACSVRLAWNVVYEVSSQVCVKCGGVWSGEFVVCSVKLQPCSSRRRVRGLRVARHLTFWLGVPHFSQLLPTRCSNAVIAMSLLMAWGRNDKKAITCFDPAVRFCPLRSIFDMHPGLWFLCVV